MQKKKIVMSLEFKTSRTHSLTHGLSDGQTDFASYSGLQ